MIVSNGQSEQLFLRRHSSLVVFLLIGLWLAVILIPVLQTVMVGSPDEAANAFFIHRLAEQQPLHQLGDVGGIFHPRSLVIRGHEVYPGSFLGFVQIAGLARYIFGPMGALIITPLAAAAALIALYALFRRYWEPEWALAGVVVIALHPAWVEFQTLPYFQNGLFTSTLIISGWLLLRHHERPSVRRVMLFAAAYGLALLIRPVEVLWTGPLVAIVLLTQPQGWRWLLAAVPVVLLMQLPWMIEAKRLYGSFLASGYAPGGISLPTSPGIAPTASTSIWRALQPASGTWNWHFWSNAWNYIVLLLPAWSLMSLAAVGFYFRRKMVNPGKIIKLGLVVLIGLFYIIYYGSWDLYPAEPATNVGALASYARYWLPLYVAMGAAVIVFLRTALRGRKSVVAIILATLFISQVVMVWYHPNAGLRARLDHDRLQQRQRAFVLSHTESNALIITGQADKIIWPDRLVGFALPQTAPDWQILAGVVAQRPVYLLSTPNQYRPETLAAAAGEQGLQVGTPVHGEQLDIQRIRPAS